jgi:DNA-binding XRE family transcriptional regulator
MTDFGDRVRVLRCRLGMSQRAFGKYFGVSDITINRWENGHNMPHLLLWSRLNDLETETRNGNPVRIKTIRFKRPRKGRNIS